MARLNEAPCSGESLDALKRRFIRQNRELAKANSTQSVRIRCLEAEISRLLTENLNLRDEILQLRNDLTDASTKRTFGGVKPQLEAQIEVLAKLVAGIGLQKKEDDVPKIPRYPNVGWGRGMGDPMDGTDGRLPAIREDKSYPRKTLDAQTMQAVSETNTESPAIGSPPVSHFRDDGEVGMPAPLHIKKDEDEPAALPANLETRRKKRESGTKLAIRRMSVFSSPEDAMKEPQPEEGGKEHLEGAVQPLRIGAKRKLGARDDEAKSTADFAYSRKASGTSDSQDESSAKEEKSARDPTKAVSRREPSRALSSKILDRKALGEKSINTDPVVSPKKTVKKTDIIKEEKEALKKVVRATEPDTAMKSRAIRDTRSRITIEDASAAVAPQVEVLPVHDLSPPVEEAIKLDLPPKTPATTDIFSAPSTEESSRPQGRNGTPPPGDLNSSTGENGRPGRRARAQVNYAEPSLAAKMRRPTEKLTDAVGKDGRPASGVLIRKHKDGVEIKVEDGIEGSAWKDMPTAGKMNEAIAEPGSPLSKKSGLLPEDNGAELLKVMRAEPEPILPTAASQAIAAMIKDSKASAARRRSSVALRDKLGSDAESGRDSRRGSSIYDFTSSSPPRSTHVSISDSKSSDREDEGVKAASRASRRHSSLASLTTASAREKEASAVRSVSTGTARFGNSIAGHKRTVSGTNVGAAPSVPSDTSTMTDLRASRRRSMML